MSKLRELTCADRGLLVHAAVLLVYTKLALPFIEFRVDPKVTESYRSGAPAETVLARARAIARLVGIASAHCPFAVACLHRALVLLWLLGGQGIPCELRIGTSIVGGALEAHAWVECAGVALDEPTAHMSRFSPFREAVVPVGCQPWRMVARWVA